MHCPYQLDLLHYLYQPNTCTPVPAHPHALTHQVSNDVLMPVYVRQRLPRIVNNMLRVPCSQAGAAAGGNGGVEIVELESIELELEILNLKYFET